MRVLAAALLLAAGCAHVGEPALEAPKVALGDQWVYESTDAGQRSYVLTAEVVRADSGGVVLKREVNGTGTAAAVHRKGTYWYVPEVRS